MSNDKRHHDLDALRAFAMLLGIVLHGVLSFIPLPVWPAQDIHQSSVYAHFLNAIHGFRMPLFFLVSGFFTAMLWKRRGLGQLLRHRARRILLPLVIATVVLWPLMIAVSIYGGIKKAEINSLPGAGSSVWIAAKKNDVEALKALLASGTDVDGKDEMAASALHWAAGYGSLESMKLLLDEGADPDIKDGNGSVPLHWAAFFGNPEGVRLLIDRGADLNAINNDHSTPLDSVSGDWDEAKGMTAVIAGILGMDVDLEAIRVARPQAAELLRSHGGAHARALADGGEPSGEEEVWGILALIFVGGAMFPVFHHLWFLYYLVYLVAGFAILAWMAERFRWKPLPGWLLTSPGCWLLLFPLTLIPQLLMGIVGLALGMPSYGPDTAAGIIPWPPKLLYYAVFFGFGALCYGREEFEMKAGRLWPISLLLAVPALLLALHWYEIRNSAYAAGFDANQDAVVVNHVLQSIASVFFTWFMIFGLIGVFRRFFPAENQRIRYVSDSSYWLYLAHLPIILFLQIVISGWDLPGLLKLTMLCVVTTAGLLVVYEYGIRYTFIGTMLNGKRTRGIALPSRTSP